MIVLAAIASFGIMVSFDASYAASVKKLEADKHGADNNRNMQWDLIC